MSAQPARGYLSISAVLAQLRAEFPDISHSKIRFLEGEGLIEPARAPSGYRRFDNADVQRLRFILTAQRDQYLPLRVIKERLGRGEPDGAEPDGAGPAGAGPRAAGQRVPGPRGPGPLLTRRELLDRAGITEPQLTELESFGLLRKAGRLYGPDALEVAVTAAALGGYGVQPRHLRAIQATVDRETALIEGVVAPILKQRGPGAREQAGRTAGELAALAVRLHQALIEGALAEAGLSAPAAAPRPQAPPETGRGARGASA
ncbi:MAG TPA: MerR family transcriptional regulator [Streptosporangiaceae bacterium]|nr:MerR family transcriptional regulator [Streptosporangiaceae bacterium]